MNPHATTIAALILPLLTTSALAGTGYTHSNAQYGFDHFRQSLELYIPTESCGPTPMVIYIHGGGWLTGQPSDVEQYLDGLIARGFAVASFSYRFSQDGVYPAQIHDVKGAVRWLRGNAKELNIDPDRLGVFGDSSGGHLATLLGTTGGVAGLEGEVGDYVGLSSRVQAVFDVNGPTDLMALGEEGFLLGEVSQLVGHSITDIIENQDDPAYADLVALVESANPISFISKDDAPFHLLHGDADRMVPASQSESLHTALLAANLPSTLELLPGVGHGIPNAAYEAGFDFLEAILIEPPRPADIDCSGAVDVNDLLIVINGWGACPGKKQPCPGDVNGNGVVNVDDLLAVIQDWG